MPSAKEVARHAGVSLTTVSRVLRGSGVDTIPESTRKRVIDAANAVGYRPNGLALALRRGVTETIGLVVPDISDAHFHRVARGVEDVAQKAGYGVLLTNTDRIVERETHAVNMLLDKRVDGIIFAGGGLEGDMHLRNVAWGRTRVVAIGPHDLDVPAVRVDDVRAVVDAVGHLAELGRSRILCLGGKPEWLTSRERLSGYRRAVAEHGLADDPDLITYGPFCRRDAEQRVKAAVGAGVRFDGIAAFNDYCAFGALSALTELGLSVPDEVAVIGCDDIPESELLGVSSISFSQYAMGATAARLVLGEELDASETILPHSLTIRRSSRPPDGGMEPSAGAASPTGVLTYDAETDGATA